MPSVDVGAKAARVLVVGDEDLVLATVDEGIRTLHECEFAPDAERALSAAARERFGAVVLFGLAGEGSPDFGLLRALVAEQGDAAIVVVSPVADPAVAERAFSLGAHSYLLCPLSSRQLEISISGRLRQRQTEHSKTRSLRDFQVRVEEMMEQAPLPMFLKDREGRYLFANAETHRYVSLEPGQMVGLTDDDIMAPESAAEVKAGDRRIVEHGETFEGERTFNFGGEQVTYLSAKFPFTNSVGEVSGVFGMAIDITDRKVSEALRAAFAAEQRNLIFELRRSREETVDRLARALVYRDAVSGAHVSRMAIVAAYLGELVGLDPEEVILLRSAAPMHDVGKIAIPDEILCKPGRLDEVERRTMQRHARIGFEILDGSQSEVLRLGAEIALTHHERWDGNGYPRRLRGEEIPIAGRIAAVADVFDALLSDRPYRAALPAGEVREVIADGRGSLFDPTVANALLENFETALILRNADGEISDEKLARFVESPLASRAA